MKAAVELMLDRGSSRTSVNDVLARAGAGKSQFYHYFDSKAALMRAVLRHQSTSDLPSRNPVVGRLHTWSGIREWFDQILAEPVHRELCSAFASELHEPESPLRRDLARAASLRRRLLQRGLRRMQKEGRLDADADVKSLAGFAAAAIQGGLLLTVMEGSPIPLRQALQETLMHLESYGEPGAASGTEPSKQSVELTDIENAAVEARTLQEWFESGMAWESYLDSVVKHRDLWHAVWARVRLPYDVLDEFEVPEGPIRLLALSEDWCGDASNLLPVIAKLAERLGWDLRVLPRDENLELMDAYLTNGRSRSIPVVIALDADWNELGWWCPRPAELQEWALGPGQQLESAERYRKIRTWYARDKGRSSIREFLTMVAG